MGYHKESEINPPLRRRYNINVSLSLSSPLLGVVTSYQALRPLGDVLAKTLDVAILDVVNLKT